MTPNLSFDIIYNIYFYINDYCTANNFWFLSKDFNILYMKNYNQAYKHKFKILFNKLFLFLSLLPESRRPTDILKDIDFFQIITCQSLNTNDKKMLKNDISFMYNLYKNFIFNQMIIKLDIQDQERSNADTDTLCHLLTNVVIVQGIYFLDKILIIKFNKNIVSINSPYNGKFDKLNVINSFHRGYDLEYIQNQLNIIENYFIE